MVFCFTSRSCTSFTKFLFSQRMDVERGMMGSRHRGPEGYEEEEGKNTDLKDDDDEEEDDDDDAD